jgi:hypothetical protein
LIPDSWFNIPEKMWWLLHFCILSENRDPVQRHVQDCQEGYGLSGGAAPLFIITDDDMTTLMDMLEKTVADFFNRL